MKGINWRLVAFVALLASIEVALSQEYIPCEKDTCPDGPVSVTFQYSNCTGEQRFYSIDLKWDACTQIGAEYVLHHYTDSYYASIWYSSDKCGKDEEFPQLNGQRYFYGSCFTLNSENSRRATLRSEAFSGGMILRNANQTFEAPQNPVVLVGVPEMDRYATSCGNLQDCKAKSTFVMAKFNQTCSLNSEEFMALNATANACYLRSDYNYYVSPRCSDQHTFESLGSRNADCSRPFSSTLQGGSKCNKSPWLTYFCSDNVPPRSDASSLQRSTLPLVLVLISLLFHAFHFTN